MQRFTQLSTQALYAGAGLLGHSAMQAESEPPGHPEGAGPGPGAGVGGAGVGCDGPGPGGGGVGVLPPPHHLALWPELQGPRHWVELAQPGLVLQRPQLQLASQL